jgi:hypothetical protein
MTEGRPEESAPSDSGGWFRRVLRAGRLVRALALRRSIAILSALILLQGVPLVWQAGTNAPTEDELVRVTAGLRRLETGAFDLDTGNPPLVGTVAAASILHLSPLVDWGSAPDSGDVAMEFLELNGARTVQLVMVARTGPVVLSLVGTGFCFWWACLSAGRAAGLVAAALWAFHPLVLSQGASLQADTAATLFSMVALTAWLTWRSAPTVGGAATAGLFTGLALVSKHVSLSVIPVLMLIALERLARGFRDRSVPVSRLAGHLIVSSATVLVVLHSAYFFEGGMARLGDVHRLVNPAGDRARVDTARILHGVERLPIFVPRTYLESVVTVTAAAKPGVTDDEEARRDRKFYVESILLRTPLGHWIAAGALLVSAVGGYRLVRWSAVVPPLACAIIGLTACLTVTVTIWRYVLPATGFGWLAVALLGFPKVGGRGMATSLVICGSLVWSAVDVASWLPSVWAYGNHLGRVAPPGLWSPSPPFDDFGQDSLLLIAWEGRHPEMQPLYAATTGIALRLLGSRSTPLAAIMRPSGQPGAEPIAGPLPGWYAMSVWLIDRDFESRERAGGQISAPEEFGPIQRYFRDHKRPTAMAGRSIAIYHVTTHDANLIRKEMGLSPLEDARHAKPNSQSE